MALSKERGKRVSCGSSLFAEAATGFSSLFLTNCSQDCKKELSQSRKDRRDNTEIAKAVVGAAILQSGEKPPHPKNFLAFSASWREEILNWMLAPWKTGAHARKAAKHPLYNDHEASFR